MPKDPIIDKFSAKNLSENIRFIFQSHNQQIMLTKITENEMFFPFLDGIDNLQVLTPTKRYFLAKIHSIKNQPGCFQLTPQMKEGIPLPSILLGDTLVLLFQLSRGAYVSQAKVTEIQDEQIQITAIDPRTNTRYKTRMPATFLPIHEALFNQLKAQKATIKRFTEYRDMETMKEPRQARDFLAIPPIESIDPLPYLSFSGQFYHAILSDISLGGCCLNLPPPAPIPEIRNMMFIFTDMVLPSVERLCSASIFCAVRHIRQSEHWIILHCMFVESLPPEILLF